MIFEGGKNGNGNVFKAYATFPAYNYGTIRKKLTESNQIHKQMRISKKYRIKKSCVKNLHF